MNINKSIGEVGIRLDGRDYVLRPSFLAMSKLGDKKEIVKKYKVVCFLFECLNGMGRYPTGADPLAGFHACRDVIDACANGGDVFPLTGCVVSTDRGLRHRRQAMPFTDIVNIAFHLMRYGIYGEPNQNVKSSGEQREMTEFNPSEAVGFAVGQFGMTLNDAWNMTMIEYQRAWDGKYPQESKTKDQQRISAEEYDALMKKHDAVVAKLNKG